MLQGKSEEDTAQFDNLYESLSMHDNEDNDKEFVLLMIRKKIFGG